MNPARRGRRLYTLTEYLSRLVAVWMAGFAVLAVGLVALTRDTQLSGSAELTASAAAEAIALSWPGAPDGGAPEPVDTDRLRRALDALAAWPAVRTVAIRGPSGTIVAGTDAGRVAGLPRGSRPKPTGIDTAGRRYYTRPIGGGTLYSVIVWPDIEYLSGVVTGSLVRLVTALVLAFGVLPMALLIVVQRRYLEPLRRLTFAVRDNRVDQLNEIARTTRSVEFHTMIASFMGLVGDATRRNGELEAAVRARTARLEAVQERMVRQEKLAALGRLAAGTAHEINNPAGYIIGNIEVLGEYATVFARRAHLEDRVLRAISHIPESYHELHQAASALRIADEENDYRLILEDIGRLVASVRDGMDRITRVVRGLNAFARHEGTRRQPVDLCSVACTAREIVANELRYDYHVEFSIDEPVVVDAVPGQLEQVLVNLLLNARDATPTGGTIAVAVTTAGDEAVVTVRDTGCGIPRDHIASIFDPFYTTKPEGAGTGLGLAVSHEIVVNTDGTIDVRSEEGGGTTFILRFPLAQSVEEIAAAEG